MDTLKERIKSLKAMMASFGVTLNDIVENVELLGLLRMRLQNGEVSKQDVLNLVKTFSDNQGESRTENPSGASLKILRFAKHGATGLEYALVGSEVIGPVVQGKNLRFILALKNIGKNILIDEAQNLVCNQEMIGGAHWIIPSDDHFRVLIGYVQKINSFLEAYGGDKITSTPFLSTTSQANKPKQWNVRLILPL